MKVKCISGSIGVTENKMYNVIQIYNLTALGKIYEIFDDFGKIKMVNECNFIKIKQHRKEILDDICE